MNHYVIGFSKLHILSWSGFIHHLFHCWAMYIIFGWTNDFLKLVCVVLVLFLACFYCYRQSGFNRVCSVFIADVWCHGCVFVNFVFSDFQKETCLCSDCSLALKAAMFLCILCRRCWFLAQKAAALVHVHCTYCSFISCCVFVCVRHFVANEDCLLPFLICCGCLNLGVCTMTFFYYFNNSFVC